MLKSRGVALHVDSWNSQAFFQSNCAPSLRLRSVLEPQRRHAVGFERPVVRDQGGAFDQSLRDQKAVEGILVVLG